jgi:hypothetical protein
MSEPHITLEVVVTDQRDAEQLAGHLRVDGPGSAQVAHTAELDGDLAQWIVLAESSLIALANLIPVLISLVDRRRIRSITVDGVHIENPSDQDVQMLLSRAGLRDDGHS